jgi:23S rRNA pseudouridine2604 synthase
MKYNKKSNNKRKSQKIKKSKFKERSSNKTTTKILGDIKKTKKKVQTLVKSRNINEAKKDNMEKKYPMRLSRHLYLKNISSRREADRLIEQGEIFVNGKIAKIGMKVEENDEIELLKNATKKLSQKKIIIFNKPKGVVSHNPQNGEKEPNDFLPFSERLSPIGRLDKASHGLILMSDDGRIVNKMLHPNFFHEKQYVVKVDKHMTGEFFEKMQAGVQIEDYFTKPARIKKLSPMNFSLILIEGKKHQIRRMCTALGYEVLDLQRVRFMNIPLGNLEVGKYRKISSEEKNTLFKLIDN